MLVDTNVWSELLKPAPHPAVVALLAGQRATLLLSTVVVAEMEFGVARAASAARRAVLRQFVDDILIQFADRLVAPDAHAARIFGETKAALFSGGAPIADLDLIIAAQAIAAGVPLVTRNVSDMARTGATIVNPWAT